MRRQLITVALLAAWSVLLTGCGGTRLALDETANDSAPPELRELLEAKLAELGKSIAHTPARAPSQGSAVFDLAVTPGAGGNTLTWTERLVGDCDSNGVVNIGELTPLGALLRSQLVYDDPLLHSGLSWWPAGNPEQDNNAPLLERPAAGSGAYNWWLARIDGDGNGLLSLGDLTPIGAHWGERLDGYRVYRKGPADEDYTLLLDPEYAGTPLLVPRSAAGPRAGQTGWISTRPVRYQFVDTTAAGNGYTYRVAPYDSLSETEGPLSIESTSPITAILAADPIVGSAPLTVTFDASATSSTAGSIVSYTWDFENDGVVDLHNSPSSTASHVYTLNGRYLATLTLVDDAGNALTVGTTISVTEAPTAILHAVPANGEVPVSVRYDGSASSDLDGQIVQYEWDLDGDGAFETNTGPVSYRDAYYVETGSALVGLRVTDNFGAVDETSSDLTLVNNYDEQEPNDDWLQPHDLDIVGIGDELLGLRGNVGMLGYDGDGEDWYVVYFKSGGQLLATTNFDNSAAELTLTLYDHSQTQLEISTGQQGFEQVRYGVLGAGIYLLKVERSVFSVSESTDYSLSLSFSALTYNETENNDSSAAANDLGFLVDPGLPSVWGNLGPGGLDGDSEDWYRVELPQPAELKVPLRFLHRDADLDLAVFAADGTTLLGESQSIDDDEVVTLEAAAPGTYFIRCLRHQGAAANYNLGFILQ